MDQPSQPKASIYDVFYNDLASCTFTGEIDLYPNVNRSIFTPFAPRFFARKKYQATVDGETVEAWVCIVGKNIQIWST